MFNFSVSKTTHRILWAIPFLFVAYRSFAAAPDGYVVSIESTTIYLDWGKASGVRPGDTFTIYREGAEIKHPVTGEVLGHQEETIASGGIENVEEKLSTAHLIGAAGAVRVGDHTRLQSAEPTEVVAPVVAAPVVTTPGSLPPTTELTGISTLRQVWQSPQLTSEAIGVTTARLSNDGKQSIVVAYKDAIEVFKWNGTQLQSVAIFRHTLYKRWLGVEAADLEQTGQDEIFATTFNKVEGQGHVIVLKMVNGELIEQVDFKGFARSVDIDDGSRRMLYQINARSSQIFFPEPYTLEASSNTFAPRTKIPLSRPRYDQTFGFTFGNWDGTSDNEVAQLYGGRELRINLKNKVWKSRDNFGGTRNEFSMEMNDRGRADGFSEGSKSGIFLPRLIHYHPPSGRDELMVPYNIPETHLRFAFDRTYIQGVLTCFAWDGKTMATLWQETVPGYMPDFIVGDVFHDGTQQLWTILTDADNKSILSVYRLP